MSTVYTQCLRRPEEGTGPSGIGVRVVVCPVGVGDQTQVSVPAGYTLNP